MIVYRVIPKNNNNIINENFTGLNTFEYNQGKEYIHFFILPENADVFQKIRYDNKNIESIVYKCNIPFNVLENNFGIGMYRYYYPNKKTPFLEVRILKDNFKKEYIIDKSDTVKEEWKNNEIYNRFVKECVDNNKPVIIKLSENKLNVTLNDNFNFLHYFTKNDLFKENINIVDYPNSINVSEINYYKLKKDNTNSSEISFLKELRQKLQNKFHKINNKGRY